MLPFTSELLYTDCIFLWSRSSPDVFADSQSQGPLFSRAVSLTVPVLLHREGKLLAKPNWHGKIMDGLPGAREWIHGQQLGAIT